MAADLMLVSPLDGWAAPLSEVPDPVFAEAMLGDGVAIDPTGGVLSAPCDGVILNIHAARHALTLRTPGGVEILMHIGLDTVALGGEGFEAHVAQGQGVRAGDRLITFDLEFLARRARSLISPIVITSGQPIRLRITGQAMRRGDLLLSLGEGAGSISDARLEPPAAAVRRMVQIVLLHGLHARPAAVLSRMLAGYDAKVRVNGANGASVLALMKLGATQGHVLEIEAEGAQAAAAVAALVVAVEAGFGEIPVA